MDQIERIQIANASRLLAKLLESQEKRETRDANRQRVALAAARGLRSNLVEREKLLPFIPATSPGWRILLELFIAEGEHQQISVTDIAVVAQLPGATVIRWLRLLEQHGLLRRRPDAFDKRRTWLALTPNGSDVVLAIVQDVAAKVAPAIDIASFG